MPWDGAGQFTRSDGVRTGANVFAQQEAGSVDPSAELFDAEAEDMARGLENAIARDGQNSPSAAIPWGGQKITGLGDGAAAGDAVNKGQLDAATGRFYGAAAVGGTGDAIALTTSPVVTALAAGDVVRFVVEAANTGAVTIAVDSIVATALKKVAGYDLDANDLRDGDVVEAMYDGTDFSWTGGTNVAASGRKAVSEADYDAFSSPEPYAGVLYLFTS